MIDEVLALGIVTLSILGVILIIAAGWTSMKAIKPKSFLGFIGFLLLWVFLTKVYAFIMAVLIIAFMA